MSPSAPKAAVNTPRTYQVPFDVRNTATSAVPLPLKSKPNSTGGGDAGEGGGADAEIVQLRVAAVGSTLPAASVAGTEKVCEPGVSPEYVFGDTQPAYPEPSRLHSNLAPASEAANSNVAVAGETTPGVDVITVSGGVLSTVTVTDDVAVFRAASSARPVIVTDPLAPELQSKL